MGSQGNANVPHIVAIPFIWPGHITPLLHLCQHLAASGCLVTLLKAPDSSSGVDEKWDNGVRIKSCLPLGPLKAPPAVRKDNHSAQLQETVDYFHQFQSLDSDNSVLPVLNELEKSSGVPVSCLITDVYVGWAPDLAEKMDVEWIALWTSTVAELVVYYHMPRLIERGVFPFAGDPSEEEFRIPGLPPLLPKNYPTFGLFPEKLFHQVLHTFKEHVQKIPHAAMVLVNSMDAIEGPAIDSLRSSGVNIRSVGPLHLLSQNLGASDPKGADDRQRDESNQIVQWLDKKPDASVIYIAFGTTMPMAQGQFEELAAALEESRQSFVWATRDFSLIPPGFQNRMSEADQGMVVSWAPQLEILRHRSTGGFVTHCGWNSVLESMSCGMPMVVRPISGDQVLTAKLLVDVWGVGIGVKGIEIGREVARKDELKKSIKALTEADPETSKIWSNAKCIKEMLTSAVNEGSSRSNLNCLMHEMQKSARKSVHQC